MKKYFWVIIILVIVSGGIFILKQSRKSYNQQKEAVDQSTNVPTEDNLPKNPPVTEINMKLKSSAFKNNENIPSKFTCDGDNISPPLNILDVPEGTESLVLIVDDPDAPAGDWVHWVVWNINPQIKEVEENTVPKDGVEGTTDFEDIGYGGPCPPSGTHRYQFKLYALDSTLELNPDARKADVEKAMKDHILDQTILVGLYSRN